MDIDVGSGSGNPGTSSPNPGTAQQDPAEVMPVEQMEIDEDVFPV